MRTTTRPLRQGFAALIAFALSLSGGTSGLSAQAIKGGPLPPGVAACDFPALANDETREGLNVRAEPDTSSAVLGRLPIVHNVDGEDTAADVHVIGVRNGWFLIEDASYADSGDLRDQFPSVYRGRGWVSGKLLTTELESTRLKAAPDANAADVVGFGEFQATAILDCKDDWVRIETKLQPEQILKLKTPLNAPANIARGWGRHSCTDQRTTCDYSEDDPSRPFVPPAPPVGLEQAGAVCLALLPKDQDAACKVEQVARLVAVFKTNVYYAMYRYARPKDPALDYQRVVIFADRRGAGLMQLFATSGDPAVLYEAPRIIKSADRTLLQIPGHESGTGNFNREQLLSWGSDPERDALRAVDSDAWLADLAKQLPSGLAVRKGVYPDYATMTAKTPLWKVDDSEACPTGGRAIIALGWQDDRVVLRSVKVERAGECGEPAP